MRPLSPLAGGSSTTASAARTSVGRFTTKPSAPCAPCSQRSTTERTKFGSRSCGMARSRVGAKESGRSMGEWSPSPANLSTHSGLALAAGPPRRAAARPRRLIGRVVDPQAAPLQVGAVELLLGALGVLGARHGDEPEAARLTRVAVGDDRYRLAGARLREQLAQLVLRDPVGEVADEELLGHLGPLLISASQRLQCGRRWAMTPRPWR